MDKLDKIFEEQKEFSRQFFPEVNRMNKKRKQDLTKEYCMYTFTEVSELLNEVNYRKHKKENKSIDEEAIKEEIIDIFKFTLNLALIWGMEAEEFEKVFNEKTKICWERRKNANK